LGEIKESFRLENVYPFNIIGAINSIIKIDENHIDIYDVYLKGLFDVMNIQLTERKIEVLNLRFKEGLSFRECADRMGISQTRVRDLYKYALKKLLVCAEGYLYSELNKKYESILNKRVSRIGTRIYSLPLATRTRSGLVNGGYLYLEDIMDLCDEEFLKINGIGPVGLKEIREYLDSKKE
jgi:predicted DNA-binding protein YlxM (UPF0122 family)